MSSQGCRERRSPLPLAPSWNWTSKECVLTRHPSPPGNALQAGLRFLSCFVAGSETSVYCPFMLPAGLTAKGGMKRGKGGALASLGMERRL